MSTASVTNSFTNGVGNTINATEMNQNFSDLVNFSNDNVVHVDGSKAMSANFDAGSNKMVNVSAGTAATDAANMANVAAVLPVGMMSVYGGASAPSGWVLCQGQALSRTTYSALYAVLGTTFGVGDGSTTFNVPDMRNSFPIGVGTTAARGATGGSADAVVVAHDHNGDTANQSISHTHALNGSGAGTNSTGGHDHDLGDGELIWYNGPSPGGFGGWTANVGGARTAAWEGSSFDPDAGYHNHTLTGSTGNQSASHKHDIDSDGVSGTGKNLPPYVGVNYIIRTGV